MKHIHFIGICGVAMSALAIALHKKGYKVTGSDMGFYPPISTHLKEVGVPYYPGWHPEKMAAEGNPDLVVVGNVAGSSNPEWTYIQENNIPYLSYPETIAKFIVKANSLVCAGTYGKSTTSALMTWILKKAGYDPNYMIGGIPINDMGAAQLTDSAWSVLEGDEYKSARWDMRPKFAHYSPTHLLLTAVVWDHADIYPTEKAYIDTFKQLVSDVSEKNGTLVLSEQAAGILNVTATTYGSSAGNTYRYSDVTVTKEGLSFMIDHDGEQYRIDSPLLGSYMADNMAAAFAMAHTIGIAPAIIIEAIASFKNIKRRLEKRFDGPVTVFDDIAHSPTKAESILKTLRDLYDGNVYAIFEPNTGNRKQQALPQYDGAFDAASTIIIPRLTRIKIDTDDIDPPVDGDELADAIKKSHDNVRYIDDDEKLITFLKGMIHDGDVVVFLGSHGFRGMIDTLVETLAKKYE